MGTLHAIIKLSVVLLALVLDDSHNLSTGNSNPVNKSRTGHSATTPASKESETLGRDNYQTLISGSAKTSSDTQDSSALAGNELTETAEGAAQGPEDGQEIADVVQTKSTDYATKKTVLEFTMYSSLSTPNETGPTFGFSEHQNGTENILAPSEHQNGTEDIPPAQHQNGTENTRGPSEHQQEKIDADGIVSIPVEQTTVSDRTSSESAPNNYINLTSESVTECLNSGEANSSLTFFCLAGSLSFETPTYLDEGFKLDVSKFSHYCKIHVKLPPDTVMRLHISTLQGDCDYLTVHVYAGEERFRDIVDLCEEQTKTSDVIMPTNDVLFLLAVLTRSPEPVSVLLYFTAIPTPDRPQLEVTYTFPKKGGCKSPD